MPLGLIQDGGRAFFHWCCNRTWQGESKKYLTHTIKAFLKWQIKMSTVWTLNFPEKGCLLCLSEDTGCRWWFLILESLSFFCFCCLLVSLFLKARESSSFLDVLPWFVLGYRQDCLSHLLSPLPPFVVYLGGVRLGQWEGSFASLLNKSG